MTPEQIVAMSTLADTLSQTAEAVTACNVELASIEIALKGHRASIEKLFDREREIKSARDKLVVAMEAAEAGLEKFENLLPEDALETATSVDEESGLAELVGRANAASLDGGHVVAGAETTEIPPAFDDFDDDDVQPGSFPDQAGSMAADIAAATGGEASEAMLNELDAQKGDADPEHAAPMQEAVDGLKEVSDDAMQDIADVCDTVIDATGDTDVEVVKVSADDIEARAGQIAEGAAGQIANSTKIGA